jgi:putative transcriptional regulator
MKNTIRIERAIKKITQEELAKSVGISRQSANAIELNKLVPSVIIALKIARIFQKRMEDVFLLEEFD